MRSVIVTHEPYRLTIWGGGTAAELRKGEESIFWQGDDAAEITDQWAEEGPQALDIIWDCFADLAEHRPE